MDEWIWVFHGENADACSAVFTLRTSAEKWIEHHSLSGMLTKMPLNCGVYDWVIESSFFSPLREDQKNSSFIQRFTSAYLEHYHYKNGQNQA